MKILKMEYLILIKILNIFEIKSLNLKSKSIKIKKSCKIYKKNIQIKNMKYYNTSKIWKKVQKQNKLKKNCT